MPNQAGVYEVVAYSDDVDPDDVRCRIEYVAARATRDILADAIALAERWAEEQGMLCRIRLNGKILHTVYPYERFYPY